MLLIRDIPKHDTESIEMEKCMQAKMNPSKFISAKLVKGKITKKGLMVKGCHNSLERYNNS